MVSYILRRVLATMPVMAILGGKDVIFDSVAIQERLEHLLPQAEIRYVPEAGHVIPGQTGPILEFLSRDARLPARNDWTIGRNSAVAS